MSGKKETDIKIAAFRFDLMDENSRKAYEFIRSFNKKQSTFLIALLLWYSEYSEEYKLTFFPDEKRIIDLSRTSNFLEKFGISKSESEKIIENYSCDQLAFIKDFLAEIEQTKKDSKKSKEKTSKKESMIEHEKEDFSYESEKTHAMEDSSDAKETILKSEERLEEKNVTDIDEAVEDDVDDVDDVDDDWLLNMAVVQSK